MMLRRAAYLQGRQDWTEIDEDSLAAAIWSGRGIPNEYSAFGMNVSIQYFEGDESQRKAELIDLLSAHPEGVAVHDPRVPHAVLLATYDEATDQFLCADPASYYGGRIMEVGESWNGVRRGGSQAALEGFQFYWIIEK